MIEPVLDLDEALDSELVRAREMVVELGPAGDRPGAPARGAGEDVARRPADVHAPAPAFGEHTREVLAEAGYAEEEIAELLESGGRRRGSAGAGDARARFMGMTRPRTRGERGLKISEVAEQAEVPVATVRHYLREGLLPEPVRTSKNMAYYPPELVERIRLIKQLQEERFMPLRIIRELIESAGDDLDRIRGHRRHRGQPRRPDARPGQLADAGRRGAARASISPSARSTASPSSAS